MNKKLKSYIEKLHTLYDKYMVNREYKNRSFENTEEFENEQKKIANEIQKVELLIKDEIQKVLAEVFSEIEIIAYDSRYFNKGKSKLGNLLCKNTKDNEECRTIQKYFEGETCFLILIQRFEDLAEDVQKNILGLNTD